MTKRIIGVNSNCYHGYSIEEALEGIAAAGFHYVELTATKGWTEHVFPNQSFEKLCAVKDKMDELGLVPFSLSGHCNLMDAQRLPDFVMNMRLANFFGCEYIVASIGEAHLKDNAKAGNELLAQNIRSLVPSLEKYGSSAGPYQEKEGPAKARSMLEELGFPQTQVDRICYLVGHHHTYHAIDGIDYQILVEADFLVNIFEEPMDQPAARSIGEKIFKTSTGLKLLTELYL